MLGFIALCVAFIFLLVANELEKGREYFFAAGVLIAGSIFLLLIYALFA